MDLEKRITAFIQLGAFLREVHAKGTASTFFPSIQKAARHNAWFTEENVLQAIGSLGDMLEEEKLRKWTGSYPALRTQPEDPKKIGVIMAGNIPLVAFHDLLSVLMSGHIIIGKLASDDPVLMPAVVKILLEIEPGFKTRVHFTDQPFNKTPGITAFIATGSNNSARYFDYYFRKYPHIIRKNRNAIALLDGKETASDLKGLGNDIFQYFGLGCRNVSKIFIPEDYNLDHFFSSMVDFGEVIHHNKYANNYHYYRTIYLLNTEKFLDNNFLLLKESQEIASPVATLYYERYQTQEELFKKLEGRKESIQCIASSLPPDSYRDPHSTLPAVPFGQTQSPELWDYADGVDTLQFLMNL